MKGAQQGMGAAQNAAPEVPMPVRVERVDLLASLHVAELLRADPVDVFAGMRA